VEHGDGGFPCFLDEDAAADAGLQGRSRLARFEGGEAVEILLRDDVRGVELESTGIGGLRFRDTAELRKGLPEAVVAFRVVLEEADVFLVEARRLLPAGLPC